MNEYDPNKTMPPLKTTDTQRFQPMQRDPEGTDPHIIVGQFPKGQGAAEVPPHAVKEIKPDVVYAYGGIELRGAVRLPNGNVQGTEGNGISLIIPAEEFRLFKEKQE